MQIHIKYFAAIREAIGRSQEVVVTQATTLGGLRDELLTRSVAHADALGRTRAVRMALNQTLCDENVALAEGAEVAFFPPVTGG